MTRIFRIHPLVLAVAATAALFAVLALAASPASARAAVTEKCPATFKVLHNDRIGKLSVPKGDYRITLINPDEITCQKASKLFAKFLQDFDGNLPGAWTLNVAQQSFKKRNYGFSVKKASGGGGGGGGGGGKHPSNKKWEKCPTFQVLHNDRIDGKRFPAGTYMMTALGGLSCEKASNLFRRFLEEDFDTALPGRWKLKYSTGTFRRGNKGKGFQVNLKR